MMKKMFCCLAAILAAMLFTTSAHADDGVRSSLVQTYGDITYTCTDTFCVAETASSDVRGLPWSAVNEGFIYSFAIYYDKIYYLTGGQGSSDVLASIYRCNIDGADNELIVNNAEVGDFWIVDGCLYYQVFRDWDNYYGLNLSGGIMKVNLNTCEYGFIVTDSDAYPENVIGDKVFYGCYNSNTHHLMNTSGVYIGSISQDDVEVASDRIVNGGAYVGIGNNIYTMDWNRNTKWIGSAVSSVKGFSVIGNACYVQNITGGYILYDRF